MNPNDYVRHAVRTEAPPGASVKNLCSLRMVRMLHAAMGMCTESGEMQDQLKRHIFYGAKLDMVNVKEEIGDMMWYLALMCDSGGFDLEEIMAQNIAKLQARYPERFRDLDALNRDLKRERDILEGGSQEQ